jgi:hypothetical protein
MNLSGKLILAGLALTFLCVSGCRQVGVVPPGHNHGRQSQRVFDVYIYTDPDHPDKCYADIDVATLWWNLNQTVTWNSDDGKDYTVDFSQGQFGSPFARTSFPVPSNASAPSGPLKANSGGYYNFAILAGIGNGARVCKKPTEPDPGLIVKP